jgi:hypothetical protein
LGIEEAPPFIYLIEVTKGTHNHIRNMIKVVALGMGVGGGGVK